MENKYLKIGEILEDGSIIRGKSAQGMIFKDEEAFSKKEGICYIPELHDGEYKYEDFLNLSNGSHDVAEFIFDTVDWQSPETVMDEFLSNDELHVCKNCDMIYISYNIENCPYCNEKKTDN